MDPKAGGGGGEEDDCVDSGAETGGSDYSRMSSASSTEGAQETMQTQQSPPILREDTSFRSLCKQHCTEPCPQQQPAAPA